MLNIIYNQHPLSSSCLVDILLRVVSVQAFLLTRKLPNFDKHCLLYSSEVGMSAIAFALWVVCRIDETTKGIFAKFLDLNVHAAAAQVPDPIEAEGTLSFIHFETGCNHKFIRDETLFKRVLKRLCKYRLSLGRLYMYNNSLSQRSDESSQYQCY